MSRLASTPSPSLSRLAGRRRFTPGVAFASTAALLAASLVAAETTAPPASAGAPTSATASVTERPDLVSARLAAGLTGHRVEITGERTETATAYANPDGTVTTEAAARPVRVRRGSGWVPVDPTLSVVADGSVAPAATVAGLTISGGGSGSLVRLVNGAGSIALCWSRSLPAPTLSGATATYANVLPNVDLKVTADVEGFEQLLVVKTRPSAPLGTIRIPLTLAGLTASRDPGGNLVFRNSAGVVAVSSAPRMWGAARDAAANEPTRSVPVGTELVTVGGTPELDLTPDPAFLADPTVTYPVIVDPGVSLARAHWTYVDKAFPTTSYYNSADIARVGTWNGGAQVDRSIFSFDVSRFRGTHVLSATLNTSEVSSYSCTAAPVDLWDAGATSTATTWNAQPAVYTKWTTVTTAKGYSSACPAGPVAFAVTALVQAWANNGSTLGNMELRAPNETANAQWKKFANTPTLSVNYNSFPKPPTSPATAPAVPCATGTGRPAVNTTTPQLKATVADADGGSLVGSFSLYVTGNGTPINSGSSASVASGGVASRTVPVGVFSNGGTYSWRARGYDGYDYSQTYSPWCEFTIDTTAPAAPVVSSTTYPANGWAGNTSGAFSWTDTSSDVGSYLYGLDQPSPATATSASSVTLSPAAGWHTLYVRAKDRAGNLSAVTGYGFGVGIGGLTYPADQDRTQRRVTLLGTAPDTKTHVSYRYRTDTAAPFADVPAGDVTYPGTSTHPAWPVGRDSSGPNAGFFPRLTWDALATVGADGLVQLEACYFTSATDPNPVCSPASNLQLVAHAFGDSYATEAIGPGTVSLLTGDFSVTATDVAVPSYAGSLSLGRSLTTLAPPAASSSATGIYGPGWTASLPGPDAGAADLTLIDRTAAGGYVLLTNAEGGEELYVKTSAGSTYPYTYAGQGDASASGSTLTKNSASSFTLTDDDGTATVWIARTVSGQTAWVVDHVTEPGSASTSSYTSDPTTGRITRVLAPVPPGVSCATTLVAGCRALDLTYAATTTATGAGTDPASWGDYAGRLASVSFTAFDPAAAGGAGAMATVVVARYRYDSTGHLRSAWDPRLDNGANNLATVYSYDGAGRLATLTPPGLATWTLGYDTVGRLTSASRPDPSGPTATTTVAYDVAFTRIGTGPGSDPDAPVELGQAATDSWGQADVPATATAVFPPSHVPAGPPTAADWPFASLSYLDVNGREVDSAAFGAGDWQVSVTEYDAHGNTVRTLSAGNRAEALAPTADTAASVAALPDSASRAVALDEHSIYSADGTEVLDTFGPTRSVVLDDGSVADARTHTSTDYDQGAPSTGGPYRLPTTITSSAYLPVDLTDRDAEVTRKGYDPVVAGDPSGWTLRAATRVTTVMPGTGSDLVTTTRYNDSGQVIESRLPAGGADATGKGNDAHSTVSTYYTVAANATYPACGGTPGVAGLVCRTGPAVQPGVAGLPDLPITTYTYTVLSAVRTATETVGTTTRTSTTGYDGAGRPASAAVSISPAQPSRTALPDVGYGYDPATGLPTTTAAGGLTLSMAYDALGRLTSSTDADGASTTSSYDLDGHLATRTDPRGTTTYSYDGTDAAGKVEHRGLATGLSVDGLPAGTPGTFTAAYDGDGALVRSRYPSGLVAATRYDDGGEPTARSYDDATGANWLSFSAAPSATGQVRHASSPGAAVGYGYDAAGRLASVADDPVGATGCTSRSYGYDPDANRTSLTSYPADATGACSTATTATSATHSYDAADRVSDPGYAYDAFGASTTVPAPDAGGAAVSIGYFANDLVASQTQAGVTKSWTLDPARRLRAATDSVSGLTATNHYGDAGDSPAWIAVSDGSWTRNMAGPDGDLAAIQTSTGSVDLQLTNLHGDVVATAADSATATGISSYFESTEFGVPRADNPVNPRYGWLGAKERSADALGGLMLMGVRLYDPATGRFLSVDPVPGGSANDYDYANQDPVNGFDLDGRWPHWRRHRFHLPDLSRPFGYVGQHTYWSTGICVVYCAGFGGGDGKFSVYRGGWGLGLKGGGVSYSRTRISRLGSTSRGWSAALGLGYGRSYSGHSRIHSLTAGVGFSFGRSHSYSPGLPSVLRKLMRLED